MLRYCELQYSLDSSHSFNTLHCIDTHTQVEIYVIQEIQSCLIPTIASQHPLIIFPLCEPDDYKRINMATPVDPVQFTEEETRNFDDFSNRWRSHLSKNPMDQVSFDRLKEQCKKWGLMGGDHRQPVYFFFPFFY